MNLNKVLLPLFFGSLALGELQRLPGLPLYAHDFILAGLLLVNWRRLKLFRPVLWFGLAGLLSLILSGFKPGGLYLVRFLTYSLLINLAVKPIYLLGFSSALAGLGLIQYLVVPDTRFLLSLNWDDHYYRLLSTLFDPNFTGIILVLGLVLIYFTRPRDWWLYLLHFSALLLTYSRSSYLALVSAMVAVAIFKKNYKIILVILVFLASLVFLPRPGGDGVKLERLFSARQRLDNYREGIGLWQQSPVFGLGFNSLRYYRGDPDSHAAAGLDSSLIFVLATTGVLGFLAYLNLLKNLWGKSLLVKITLMALLVDSLFINSLFYAFVMIWLWSLPKIDK